MASSVTPPGPPTANPPPRTVALAGAIRLHAVQTGWVAVKRVHREFRGPPPLRLPAILLDRHWTPWLPILAWAIEHPDGVVVVDTGELDPSFDALLEACDPADRLVRDRSLRLHVEPGQTIDAQLRRLGIEPEDVGTVVLTHLHADHSGGLRFFPSAKVLVSRVDWEGPRSGALACRWPVTLEPALVDAPPDPGYPVTRDGAIRIVSTPGHTRGHQSVVVRDDERGWLLAGDVSFSEAQLLAGGVPGVVEDVATTRSTYAAIRRLARERPLVYLPSHDPGSPDRFTRAQAMPAP